jgi:signal transduction histidine kinase
MRTAPIAVTVGTEMGRIRSHDRLVALAWLVACAADIALENERGLSFTDPDPTPVQTWLFLVPFVATLLWRHRRPLAALAIAYATMTAAALAGGHLDKGFMPVGMLAFLTWCAARAAPGRRDVATLVGVSLVGVVAVTFTFPDHAAADVIWASVMLIALPVAAGRAWRQHEQLTALLAERGAQLEAHRDERARLAVAQERERIAGELHDVVAHGVSEMVVQAGAARRLIAVGGDSPAGHEAIAAVEASGRAALDELRRLLGVLRRGDEALALAPQPSLARADALVARLNAEGRVVTLTVEGEPAPLPPGLDLVAYRVIEEALAGTDGPARVTVRHRPREVELALVIGSGGGAPAPEPAARFGVRERAALFGGEVTTGRTREGDRLLTVRLPVGRAAAVPA